MSAFWHIDELVSELCVFSCPVGLYIHSEEWIYEDLEVDIMEDFFFQLAILIYSDLLFFLLHEVKWQTLSYIIYGNTFFGLMVMRSSAFQISKTIPIWS